jgi:hypothetical protein
MSDPEMPQSARQAIASLPDKFSPGVVEHMVTQGQTASQNIQNQIRERTLQERISNDAAKQQNDAIKTNIETEKAKAYEDHQRNTGKQGGGLKVPTAVQTAAATEATKEVFGDSADVNSDDFKSARNSIAARGMQIMEQNKAVNANQAFAMAADEAKKNGEISKSKVPATYATLLGQNLYQKTPPTTKTTFKGQGRTSSEAIPLKAGVKSSDLVEGKFYKNAAGQVAQYSGGHLVPVQ